MQVIGEGAMNVEGQGIWTRMDFRAGFLGGTRGKKSTCQCRRHKRHVSIPGLGRSPGGAHGNPSSVLAWRIPWTEEPGGLQSIGLQSWT